jgi:hypothetical protein
MNGEFVKNFVPKITNLCRRMVKRGAIVFPYQNIGISPCLCLLNGLNVRKATTDPSR